MANIVLQPGIAAMLGKPLTIAKSEDVAASSELTGTNRIEYDTQDEAAFEKDEKCKKCPGTKPYPIWNG